MILIGISVIIMIDSRPYSFLYLQDTVHFMLDERALLALQEYAGFEALQPMPHVFGNIHTIGSALLANNTGLHDFAIVFIGRYPDLALQNDKRLGLGGMVMHGDECARLQTVEEPMAFIIQTLMEIVIHPQPW